MAGRPGEESDDHHCDDDDDDDQNDDGDDEVLIVTIIGDAHQNDCSMILKYPFQGGKESTKKKTSKPWKALADPSGPWEGNRCGL